MTGTADTEAFEFQQIYHLETVVIPTHQPMVRKDENDQVFRTFQEKVDAIIADIKDCHERGQPVLVGTTSIENSELLSQYLREGEAAARGAQREAARARGRDRRAGGQVEGDHHRHQHGRPRHRHRARRQPRAADPEAARRRDAARRPRRSAQIDTHARRVAGAPRRRGRRRRPAHHRHRAPRVAAHRQPAARPLRPPGRPRLARASTCRSRTRCCASSAASASASIMQKLKMPEGEPIEHPIVNRSIEKAQNRVESRNFDIRKQLLEYDDVANDQRARDLPAAQRAARERRHLRDHPQHDPRA